MGGNALSDSFGRLLTVLPRQQAELAVRGDGNKLASEFCCYQARSQ